MTPAYASLKPTRSKSWNDLQIHTAGVSATLMSRMVKLKDASAEAGVAFLCEFAELCPRFIGVYDYTVILTYLSLFSAFGGMTFASRGMFNGAILCLLASFLMLLNLNLGL